MLIFFFFFQAEDGIRDRLVTGVQTCALPISVEVLERVGPKRLAYLQVLETKFLAFDDQDQLKVGDEVAFFLTPEKSMVFDIASGRRLRSE